MFTYEIGGEKYMQKELVWGQWLQVMDEIEDVILPEELRPLELMKALKDKLPKLLAVVLVKEDEALESRHESVGIATFILTRSAKLAFMMTPQQMIDVVSDFFDANPLHLLLKNLIGKVNQVQEKIAEGISNSGMIQKEQSSTSQEETS